jgi:16S rRNA (adenine1518-N6/adenine1519-N6)-dimethyltransferase
MHSSFAHKKSLGQHFLNSDIVPAWLCAAGDVTTGDVVVEIGPGTGALTSALLAHEATVHAIETDTRAIAVLCETFAAAVDSEQLVVHHLDARTLTLSDLPLTDHQFKVVANIPYYLSGHLLRVCLEHPVQPSDLIFLVQKEVAKRAAAPLPPHPGAKGSLLALSLQVYGDVAIDRAVSRGHFTPPPQVDSAILAVRNISRAAFSNVAEADFFVTIRAGFGKKRKQLGHNLREAFGAERATAALTAAALPATIRAEDVALAEWLQLAHALAVSNK